MSKQASKQTGIATIPAFGDVVYFEDSQRPFKVVRPCRVVVEAGEVEGAQICDADKFTDPAERQAGPSRPLSELRSNPAEDA